MVTNGGGAAYTFWLTRQSPFIYIQHTVSPRTNLVARLETLEQNRLPQPTEQIGNGYRPVLSVLATVINVF